MFQEKKNKPFTYRNGYSGIYIHFPFCLHKCSYCDFYSIVSGKDSIIDQRLLFENYKLEIEKRIEDDNSILDRKFDTIFIGGGTPSLMNLDYLESFLQYLYKKINITTEAEITLEANPENINANLLNRLYSMGINRVNVGVQSFFEKHLHTLDRYFDKTKYEKVLDELSSSQIERIGIDLMFGIPGQSKDEFYTDLNKALEYRINHISLYSLTMEKGTKYFKDVAAKIASQPDEDLQVALLEELPDYLLEKKFYRYEISNYSKEGEESKHNLKYWMIEEYLGIGPGAHGWTQKGRYANSRNVDSYLSGKFDFGYEAAELETEIPLCILRITKPIDMDSFLDLIPRQKEKNQQLLKEWKQKGICTYEDGIFQWNKKALLFLDSYIEEFVSANS